jgi:hypothetical protein
MAYLIEPGIQISLTGASGTWQKLTDHNRQPIDISLEIIQQESRMANGKMRKYVIAKKNTISASWKYVPSKDSECVDGFYSAAWLESFYNSNVGLPIYVKVTSSKIQTDPALGSLPSGTFLTAQTGSKTYNVYMNDFTKTIINRTKISDYVDMSIEFVEI